jgi:hypothetical protein
VFMGEEGAVVFVRKEVSGILFSRNVKGETDNDQIAIVAPPLSPPPPAMRECLGH